MFVIDRLLQAEDGHARNPSPMDLTPKRSQYELDNGSDGDLHVIGGNGCA